ncbi:Cupredoxin [Stachybotrys elegans]|uniref:Cupredoxin n=1 Tax=Stachybotrys elegans TaxID=80388 RepID=A0A8K0WPY7_9HYPO|nr:Cupredoxin [Stachybotrys elegans]
MYTTGFLALSLLPAVLAQYSGASTTVSLPSASTPAPRVDGVHVVTVGEGGLVFNPPEVQAAVGDVVEFHFYPMAHSVAQSSFDMPCQPLNTTGFFSGPVPVQSGMAEDVFRVTVANDRPMWYYCATGRHCQSGMVGVINPPATGRNLAQYAQAAAHVEQTRAPLHVGGGSLGPVHVPNSGMSVRGDIRWALAAVGLTTATFVAGLVL